MIDPKTGEEPRGLAPTMRILFRWMMANPWDVLPWVVIFATSLSIVQLGYQNSVYKLIIIGLSSASAVAYTVKKHAKPIFEMGVTAWGKIIYAILAAIVLLISKMLADHELRLLLQSDPGMFPTAQQAITLLNVVIVSLGIVGIFIELTVFLRFFYHMLLQMLDTIDVFNVRQLLGLPAKKRWFEATKAFANFSMWFYSALAIVALLSLLNNNPFQKLDPNEPETTVEALLLVSSFVINQNEISFPRFCTNLDPDVFVSPVTNEPMPGGGRGPTQKTRPDSAEV